MVDRPRVAHVYRDYFDDLPGGIERHIHEVCHGLAGAYEMEAVIASQDRRHHVRKDGEVVVRMTPQLVRIQGVPVTPSLPRDLRRGAYDIIHAHAPNPTGEIALRVAGRGSAKVLTYHCDPGRARFLFPAYRMLLRSVTDACSNVVVSSAALIESSPVLSRFRDRREEDLVVIPFGVDTDRFSPGSTERSEVVKLGWGSGPTVLFLGRVRYYKGLDVLLDAMASVDARLVVAGEGPLADEIKTRGRALLGERFVSIARVPEDLLPDVYRAADLFCLPSTSEAETFGLAAIEAMASGLPVITTEVGTATSVVNVDGTTGVVVPAGDPSALAEALTALLGDPGSRVDMGAAARDHAVAHFSRTTMLDSIDRLYRQVLAERGRGR